MMTRRQAAWRAALLTGIGLALFAGLESVAFYPDESCKIAYSAPFEALAAGRFDDPIWQDREDKYLNPVLTYYVIGIARRIGGYDAARLTGPWDFRRSDAENVRLGRMPDQALLWWGRAGVTAAAGGGLFVLFLLMTRAAAPWAALAWLAAALASPFLRTALRRALNEGVLVAAVALALWAFARAVAAIMRRPDSVPVQPALAWTALAGAATGLAAQTKLNGGFLVAGFALVLLLAGVRPPTGHGGRIRALLLAAAVLAASTAGTFIAANPSLWSDPLRDTVRMARTRVEILKAQVLEYPADAIDGARERLARVPPRVLHPDLALPGGAVPVALFAFGFVLSVRSLARWLRGAGEDHVRVVLTVVGFVVSAPGLLTPLDWSRYYVLPAIVASMHMAFGLEWTARAVLHSVAKTGWRTQ
jgi:4-amino-4-deoxy-L-arabinose transferase-like glycosyltransferase